MADALAGAFDDAPRIRPRAIGELDVDVGGVWDQADRHAAHANAAGRTEAEGEDPVRQVHLLLGVRHHVARQRTQGAKRHRGLWGCAARGA